MEKNKFWYISFSVGLLLLAFSWYLSYPLAHSSYNDVIFNHISILYWFGFALTLTSMFMIAISCKSIYLKWLITVGCIIVFYSLFYFYNTMSSSDASFFRGLTQEFIKTGNLNSDFNSYYQWPGFFILAKVATMISGIELVNYEFLLITVIGLLLSTALYIYFSRFDYRGAIIAVLAFFVLSFSFLNYQAAPFTLAFCILFLLFNLEIYKPSMNAAVVILILFTAITFTHAFVPLFFVAYLLIRLIISKEKKYYLSMAVLCSLIYLIFQINFSQRTFFVHLIQVFTVESDYSNIVSTTIAPVSSQIDLLAQSFSRIVTISIALLCLAGFLFLLFKRKLREIDKAIILTGLLYSGIGAVLYTLGTRAIPLIFVPVAVGVLYLYRSSLKSYLKYSFLFLLILVVFIPIHSQYVGYPITYQTNENVAQANFLLRDINWSSNFLAISDNSLKWYISPQVQVSKIDSNYNARFNLQNITLYSCIVYSIGLERSLQEIGISLKDASSGLLDQYDVIYNSGSSYIALKSR